MARIKEVRCDDCRWDDEPCEKCKRKMKQNASRRAYARSHRSMMRDVADSLGMSVVRGALGGVYIE